MDVSKKLQDTCGRLQQENEQLRREVEHKRTGGHVRQPYLPEIDCDILLHNSPRCNQGHIVGVYLTLLVLVFVS